MKKIPRRILISVIVLFLLCSAQVVLAAGFDHRHDVWTTLLQRHVSWNPSGTASQVDYAAFSKDRVALRAYLDQLSSIPARVFDTWDNDQQLAFLINAYNAFTVELILTRYPDLESIKDLGFLFSSPWKKEFFRLLGQTRYLDDIEHNLIRGSGRYDEPLIHFAVNCASIGCPALRDEAYVAERLDEQLLDSTRRFLSDRSRNRFDVDRRQLEVSSLFDWYAGDFAQGWRGYDSLHGFFRTHADWMTDSEQQATRLRNGRLELDFLDYDWALNGR
jgi:hypothetical protein